MNPLIIVKNKIDRPVNKIWELWTNPKHIIAWKYSSDDWVCLQATNNFIRGGSFNYTMTTKDGSSTLDHKCTYDNIILHQLIEYTFEDGRKAKVIYSDNNIYTEIVEVLEAESKSELETQHFEWKSILNNFKAYAESSC